MKTYIAIVNEELIMTSKKKAKRLTSGKQKRLKKGTNPSVPYKK